MKPRHHLYLYAVLTAEFERLASKPLRVQISFRHRGPAAYIRRGDAGKANAVHPGLLNGGRAHA